MSTYDLFLPNVSGYDANTAANTGVYAPDFDINNIGVDVIHIYNKFVPDPLIDAHAIVNLPDGHYENQLITVKVIGKKGSSEPALNPIRLRLIPGTTAVFNTLSSTLTLVPGGGGSGANCLFMYAGSALKLQWYNGQWSIVDATVFVPGNGSTPMIFPAFI